jgi:hypothetical protein
MLSLKYLTVGPVRWKIGKLTNRPKLLHETLPNCLGVYMLKLTELQKIITLILTALAICSLIPNVLRKTELLLSLGGHSASQYGEDVPPLRREIVAWSIACVFGRRC